MKPVPTMSRRAGAFLALAFLALVAMLAAPAPSASFVPPSAAVAARRRRVCTASSVNASAWRQPTYGA
jgi:hypothetical protein